MSSSLGLAGIVGGGVNVQRSLHPQYHDEVPTHYSYYFVINMNNLLIY